MASDAQVPIWLPSWINHLQAVFVQLTEYDFVEYTANAYVPGQQARQPQVSSKLRQS